MTDQTSTDDKSKDYTTILRGVKPVLIDDENNPDQKIHVTDDNGKPLYNTKLLLMKNDKDQLFGFVQTDDGVKHSVVAFINERKDESKQNFLTLSEAQADGTYKQIATGNAVNHRKDDEKVYFDEVLFQIKDTNEVIKGKVTAKVDEELHKKIGFTSPKEKRPKYNENGEDKPITPTPSNPSSETVSEKPEDKKKPRKPKVK